MCKLLQWACSNEVDVARKIAEKFCQSVEKNVRVLTILLLMCERCFVLFMQSGRTLLHFAAELDDREAVECLLEKKADADAKDTVNNIMNFMVGNLCIGLI